MYRKLFANDSRIGGKSLLIKKSQDQVLEKFRCFFRYNFRSHKEASVLLQQRLNIPYLSIVSKIFTGKMPLQAPIAMVLFAEKNTSLEFLFDEKMSLDEAQKRCITSPDKLNILPKEKEKSFEYIYGQLAGRIKEQIKTNDITYRALGSRLGVYSSIISKIINRQMRIDIYTLKAFADNLNCTLNDFNIFVDETKKAILLETEVAEKESNALGKSSVFLEALLESHTFEGILCKKLLNSLMQGEKQPLLKYEELDKQAVDFLQNIDEAGLAELLTELKLYLLVKANGTRMKQ